MHSNTNDNALAALNLLLELLDKVPCSERVIGFDTENPVIPNGFSEKISVITVQMHATMNENNLTVAKKESLKHALILNVLIVIDAKVDTAIE